MVNRAADYQTKRQPILSSGADESWFPPLNLPGLNLSSLKAGDFKKLMGSAEELVLKYPGPALASAFMVGVLVAWWIKRK